MFPHISIAGDKYREISFQQLLDLSLPYAEISYDGKVCVAKAEGSGGVLNFSTCAQQILYEIPTVMIILTGKRYPKKKGRKS